MQQPEIRLVGIANLLFAVRHHGAARKAHQRKLHVRLPGGEPHVADQHVIENDAVGSGNGELVRAAGLLGRQVQAPVADTVGLGGSGRALQRSLDLLAGVGPSPQVNGTPALQDHVAAQNLR